ncbi:MAG: T9SS type A sorting domain-containing protein [bacterium]|nr:T9SS type A sorting domain-containing protein [bacterium]
MIRFLNSTLQVFMIAVLISPALADESRRIMVHDESGEFLEREWLAGDAETPAPVTESQRDEILWHYNQDTILYSTEFSMADRLFTGAWDGVAMFDLTGDGIPLWAVNDGVSYTSASGDLDIFGSATETPAINGVTISAWEQGDSQPLWAYALPDCSIQEYCIVMSRDGSILTVALSIPGTYVRLCSFDAQTGEKLSTFDCPSPASPRALEICDDGSLVVVRASATLYVVETATGTQRWTVGVGASASPLAFSGDGSTIASGWSSMRVYRWNGSTYAFAWATSGGGSNWYLRCCALSTDGSALVAAWNSSSYNQNKMQWYDTTGSTPEWTFLGPLATGSYQELPSCVAIDPSGQYAVMGAWGDEPGLIPEVQVFRKTGSTPVFAINSPGSIFDVAICSDSGGNVYVSACGKHVHANEMGSGGDLYAAAAGVITAIEDDIAPPQSALGIFPNPFNPTTTLRCLLPEAGRIDLDIYGADGRLLRTLAQGTFTAGTHNFTWNGLDDAGQPQASGIYLARLRTAGSVVTEQVVLVR